MRPDLEFFQQKDVSLANTDRSESVPPEPIANDAPPVESMQQSKISVQRQQWEQTERENIDRDEIHYQDVFFDEARTHGVGYYAFSADKGERQRQQSALDSERNKTRTAQEKREQFRANRDKIVFDRMFAAKNRQRARSGLPLLAIEEFEAMQAEAKARTETQTNDDFEEKREKAADKSKDPDAAQIEDMLDAKRRQHLRPWDMGKTEYGMGATRTQESPEWAYKPEKEPLSQREWNEQKRSERNAEFAPPSSHANAGRDNKNGRFESRSAHAWSPPSTSRSNDEPTSSHAYSSVKPVDEPPAVNPLQSQLNKLRNLIAPTNGIRPVQYETEQLSSYQSTQSYTAAGDIGASIDAGLQYLREKSDKHKPGTKSSWITKTTYEE